MRAVPFFAATPAHPRRSLRPALALLAALTGLLLLVPPAAAHDQLVAADPAPDAVLTQAPSVLTLEFSAALLDLSATVEVTGPAGPVATEPPVVADRTVTTTLVGALPDGAYAVAWRVVSSDGHPVEGAYSFTVDAPEPSPSPSATPTPAPTGPADTPAVTPSPSAPPTTDADDGDGSPAASGAATGAVVVGALVVAGLAALAWWAVRRSRA